MCINELIIEYIRGLIYSPSGETSLMFFGDGVVIQVGLEIGFFRNEHNNMA